VTSPGGSSHHGAATRCLDGTQLQRKTRSFLRWGNVDSHTSVMDDDGVHAYRGVPSGLRHPGATPRGTAAAFCD